MEIKKNCPKCNKIIFFKRKGDLQQSIKNNSKCKQCRAEGRVFGLKPKIFERQCPRCLKNILHTTKQARDESVSLNILCKSCGAAFKGKNNVKLTNYYKDRRIIKNCKICRKEIEVTKWNENRIYCSRICYQNDSDLDRAKFFPSFSKDGCLFFDKLNKENGWGGKHGLNGGEKKVMKYWVDYYESNLNIVIEWDEKFHKYQMDEDNTRQLEIINNLNCQFYRINSKTLEINKINKDGSIEKKEKNYRFR